METKKSIVAFHVGRGGRFYNAGHLTYHPDIHSLWEVFKIGGEFEDFEDFDDIECETGVLDFDGDYDTWIVKDVWDCTDREWNCLLGAYEDGQITDKDVFAAVEEYFWGIEAK